MSRIIARLNNTELIIEKDKKDKTIDDIEIIKLENLDYNAHHTSELNISNKKQVFSIIFMQKISSEEALKIYKMHLKIKQELLNESKNINEKIIISNNEEINYENTAVIVYAKDKKVYYVYGDLEVIYKDMIELPNRGFRLHLNKTGMTLSSFAYVLNKYKFKIDKVTFCVNDEIEKEIKLNIKSQRMNIIKFVLGKNIFTVKISRNTLLNDNIEINSHFKIALYIDNIKLLYNVCYGRRKFSIYNYTPFNKTTIKDFVFYVRKTMAGNLVLIKRLKEDYEKTLRYKLLENFITSFILYHMGKLVRKFRKTKINLFYEKFAEKSEEGVYELSKMCNKSNNSKNYFIIDKNSNDYNRIKDDKYVIPKYSFKYYYLIYTCDKFIASEAPSHLNLLRSSNKYFRRATYERGFIFLQHGIIYMKNLGLNSSFAKDREAECEYMVVSSDKEKEVVCEMLGYSDKNLLKTGLAMYSDLEYNHINNNSDDYVMIMLTWKPYEEHLIDFEKSSYYQNVVEVCNKLKKYLPSDKILIVAHPKAQSLIENTDLKDSLLDEPISKALTKTKLLITDYSSICYNAFYQGAGVIFYQPDLELYEKENGKLVPRNDEYIGKRAFNIKELENIFKENIHNNKINLNELRTKKEEENYHTINEFYDGKNTERIYNELLKRNII